jgi:GxxExxY protein
MEDLLYKELTGEILDSAIMVHRELGPGLLESAYLHCLHFELLSRKMHVAKEVPLPLIYKEVKLDTGYRLDLVVENKIIIEIKSVEALAPIHTAQTLTYLKLSGYRIGLLINFNVEKLLNGYKRYIR